MGMAMVYIRDYGRRRRQHTISPALRADILRAAAEGAMRNGNEVLAHELRQQARRIEFRDGWRHSRNRNGT